MAGSGTKFTFDAGGVRSTLVDVFLLYANG
jgi:hypothetical protein